ncbi:hypothetical protein NHX12_008827, partial [Muraenolepis orangiensis]
SQETQGGCEASLEAGECGLQRALLPLAHFQLLIPLSSPTTSNHHQMGGQERICLKDPNTPARKWGPESSRASEEEVANKKSRCMDESDGNRKTKALSDKQLLQVAESLGQEWEQAAIYLKLSITDLDNIKAERQTSVSMQKLKMLVLWKNRRP